MYIDIAWIADNYISWKDAAISLRKLGIQLEQTESFALFEQLISFNKREISDKNVNTLEQNQYAENRTREFALLKSYTSFMELITGNVMFHGPLVVLCISHAYILDNIKSVVGVQRGCETTYR